MRSIILTFLLFITPPLLWRVSGTQAYSNNLTLGSTITIVSSNQISFTIQWDNSWYVSTAPDNWDAVWLFVKYKDCATSDWLHAPLSTTVTDHSVTGGVLQVEMPAVNDGSGVYVRRAAFGSGNIAAATVTLQLNGIATGSYNFKVFGIEMVYNPQADFQVGDGAAASKFSNNTITAADQAAGISGATLGGGASNVPNTYPMGQSAFYCMKYEITQEQYVDFLNTLTYDQQVSRTTVLPNVMATNWAMGSSGATAGRNRNSIKVKTSGVANTTPAEYACDLNDNGTSAGANYNEADDGLNIACNYLSWADVAAYLDWACLRPMTDLEFEKICRGIGGRVAGEYVWGTTGITQAKSYNPTGCTSGLTNPGAENEISTASGNGLTAYGAADGLCRTASSLCDIVNTTFTPLRVGPLRVGFAATATTTRLTAGATYYGVLDMGGNVWERVVAVNATGVLFTGTLGDGVLTSVAGYSGNATNTDWPGIDATPARGVTGAAGSGRRGGSWYESAVYIQTSNRSYAATTDATRACGYGGRGVR